MKTAANLAALVIVLTVIAGWCINVWHLIEGVSHFGPASNVAMLLLRGVGVFVAPLGSILGLFF